MDQQGQTPGCSNWGPDGKSLCCGVPALLTAYADEELGDEANEAAEMAGSSQTPVDQTSDTDSVFLEHGLDVDEGTDSDPTEEKSLGSAEFYVL